MIGKQRVIPVVSMFNSRRLLSPPKIVRSDDGFHPSYEPFSVVVKYKYNLKLYHV